MLMREVQVKKTDGMQQRDCKMLADRAMRFDSEITIESIGGEKQINAKSIMGVLSLGAKFGTKFIIIAKGSDEEDAATEMANLFERNFTL